MVQKFIKIPKDLKTDTIKFMVSMPVLFLGKIDENIWKNHIININLIIEKYDGFSILNIFRFLLIFPLAFDKFSFKNEVSEYIKKINAEISSTGIVIVDPFFNGYTELLIIIN